MLLQANARKNRPYVLVKRSYVLVNCSAKPHFVNTIMKIGINPGFLNNFARVLKLFEKRLRSFNELRTPLPFSITLIFLNLKIL